MCPPFHSANMLQGFLFLLAFLLCLWSSLFCSDVPPSPGSTLSAHELSQNLLQSAQFTPSLNYKRNLLRVIDSIWSQRFKKRNTSALGFKALPLTWLFLQSNWNHRRSNPLWDLEVTTASHFDGWRKRQDKFHKHNAMFLPNGQNLYGIILKCSSGLLKHSWVFIAGSRDI